MDDPKPDANALADLSPIGHWLVVTLATFVVSLFAAWLANQLVASEVAKRGVARVFSPVLSHLYPEHATDAASTIVAIDDEDLRALGMGWPVHLDYYGRLIDRLARYEPRAIFLDVVFLDERPIEEVDALIDASCRAATRSRPVPVFLASLKASGRTSPTEQRVLAAVAVPRPRASANATADALRDRGNPAYQESGPASKPPPVLVPCVVAVAANLRGDSFDRTAWEYPLRVAEGSSSTRMLEGARLDSPAVAMACSGEDLTSAGRKTLCGRDANSDPAATMALTWPYRADALNEDLSLRPDPANPGFYSPSCSATTLWSWLSGRGPVSAATSREHSDATDGSPARIWDANGFADVKRRIDRLRLPLCPYTRTLPVRALGGQGLSEDQVIDSLRRRFLLIGTDFQSSGDIVFSPSQGALPGVHAHAIALDNLLAYDGRYRASGEFELLRPWTPASLFALSALLASSGLVCAWRIRTRRRMTGLRNWGPKSNPTHRAAVTRCAVSFAATLLAGLVFMLVVYAAGDRLFRVGPLSVTQYMMMPPLIKFLDRGERVGSAAISAWRAVARSKTFGRMRRLVRL